MSDKTTNSDYLSVLKATLRRDERRLENLKKQDRPGRAGFRGDAHKLLKWQFGRIGYLRRQIRMLEQKQSK